MEANFGPDGKITKIKTSGQEAVRIGGTLISEQIRSLTKLKMGLYFLAASFVLVASLLIVFAPEGRENASSLVAVALIAVALGSAGFGAFALKTPIVSAKAARDQTPND